MCEVLESMDPDDSNLLDADKTTYDKEAVSNVHSGAVKIAKAKYRLELSPDEAKVSLGLFPKVWFTVHPYNEATHTSNRLLA